MEIEKAQEMRRDMQQEILSAIQGYESATGLSVTCLQLTHAMEIGKPKRVLRVDADVGLQEQD